jgi:hypothetical protein
MTILIQWFLSRSHLENIPKGALEKNGGEHGRGGYRNANHDGDIIKYMISDNSSCRFDCEMCTAEVQNIHHFLIFEMISLAYKKKWR